MPTYKYRREDGTTFEVRQKITADPLEECPDTGQPVERVITGGMGFHLKGGGWYSDGYSSPDASSGSKSESGDDSSGSSSGSENGSSGNGSAENSKPAEKSGSDAKKSESSASGMSGEAG